MRIANWFSRLGSRSLYRISGFAGLDVREAGDTEAMWHGTGFAYRLLTWPKLRQAYRTAPIYRALSVMTTRPVSVAWFSRCSGLPADQAQSIVSWLVSQGYAQELTLAGSDRGTPERRGERHDNDFRSQHTRGNPS
jgi:hypothetical protein